MTIHYAIEGSKQNSANLPAWIATTFPLVTAHKFLEVGTGENILFDIMDGLSHDQTIHKGILKLSVDTLKEIESLLRSIHTFDLIVTGSMNKYDPIKKAFIVELKHRTSDELVFHKTIQAHSKILCMLNPDGISFSVDLESLNNTEVFCYHGDDDYLSCDSWRGVTRHIALSDFINLFEDQVKYGHINTKYFVDYFIAEQFKNSIQEHLDLFTKQAQTIAFVDNA